MRTQPLSVIVFEVGGQFCALPTDDVRELIRAVAILPLPSAPPFIQGVIDVRGTIVPVLDLRSRFGLPARPVAASDHLLIASAGTSLVALRADRAVGLVELAPADVEEVRPLCPGMDSLACIARTPDRLVLIHDLRTLLS